MSNDESLSLRERLVLVQTLSGLPAAQVEQLIFAMKPPTGVVSPSSAPVANRIAELLGWCEGSSGPGLRELQNCLDSLLIKDNTSSTNSLDLAKSEFSYENSKRDGEKRIDNGKQWDVIAFLGDNNNGLLHRLKTIPTVLMLSIFMIFSIAVSAPWWVQYFPEEALSVILIDEKEAVKDRWIKYIEHIKDRDLRAAYGMLSTNLQNAVSYQAYKSIFEDTVDIDLLALRNIEMTNKIASAEVYFEKTSSDGTKEDWHGTLIFKKENGVWFIDDMSGLKRD
jgi:hypothetical protein